MDLHIGRRRVGTTGMTSRIARINVRIDVSQVKVASIKTSIACIIAATANGRHTFCETSITRSAGTHLRACANTHVSCDDINIRCANECQLDVCRLVTMCV